MHVALIGFGLVSLSSPRSLEATQAEAISVDFVPVEDNAQMVKGDEKAPLGEKPAPTPTDRPDTVADAQNVGNNKVDSKAPAVPDAKPKEVEIADAAKKQPIPTERPEPEIVETKEKPTPVPATEVAPVPTPRQEVTPDPVKTADVRPTPKPEPQEDEIRKAIEAEAAKAAKEEAAKAAAAEKAAEEAAKQEAAELAAKKEAEAKEKAEAEAKKLADAKAKAKKEAEEKKAAEAAAAKAKERKDADKAAKEAANRARSTDDGSLETSIEDMLNKEKSAGGAQASIQPAATGAPKAKNKNGKLSQSEEGAFLKQLEGCWSMPAGAEGMDELQAVVVFKVDPATMKVDGRVSLEARSGNTAFDSSAVRAINRCSAQGLQLPAGKEDIWSEVAITFKPGGLFF